MFGVFGVVLVLIFGVQKALKQMDYKQNSEKNVE